MAQSQTVVRENPTTKHRQLTTEAEAEVKAAEAESDSDEFDTDAQTAATVTDVRTCSECDGQLIADGTETFCGDCGLVEMDYRIDHGPEWFPGGYRATESRVGSPQTVSKHDGGLSTEIGRYRDGQGRKLSLAKRRRLGRLRVQHSRAKFRTKKERNLGYANGEIHRLTSALDYSRSVRDRACHLFKRAHTADLVCGRSLDAVAAAVVYAVCRDDGIPTTPHAVADVARVSRSKVLHAFGVLCRDLDDVAPGLFTPNDHIPRLTSMLDLSDAVARRAHELACDAEDAGLCSGVSPSGFAGACIYTAAREVDLLVPQIDIADAADSTAQTVRSHWQTLREEGYTNIDVDDDDAVDTE